jgi:fatty acid desaturase
MLTETYSHKDYGLSKDTIQEFHALDESQTTKSILSIWVQIVALGVLVTHVIPFSLLVWLYVPLAFFIAGRQGVLLQLVHEGAHSLLSSSKAKNHFIGQWFCAFPIGVDFNGYTSGHVTHHGYAGTTRDPKSDSDKYSVTDFKDPRLYALFLRDMFGLSALSVFFDYSSDNQKSKDKTGFVLRLYSLCSKLAKVGSVQIVILLVAFQGDLIKYILFWPIPAATAHMVLMRFRGIAEHGLARQLDERVKKPQQGMYFTRSFFTEKNQYGFKPVIWLEKLLIGSLNVNYHHEHHLFPKVPHYNLKKVHAAISETASQWNPDIYAKGYFAAALLSLKSSYNAR